MSGVSLLKLRKPLPQGSSRVRHVLHDVRSTPDFPHPDFFIVSEHRKGVLKGLDSVIHTEKDVAVTVGHPLKGTALQQ
jgi:hypothetical protein